MLPKKLCSLLLLSAAVVWPQMPGNFSGLMGQLNQQVKSGPVQAPQLRDSLRALSNELSSNAWNNPQQRQQASNLVSGYLGTVRPQVGNDPELARAMAGVYRQLGSLQYGAYGRTGNGWSDPRGAWMNYRNSYLLLGALRSQYPQDRGLRDEMEQSRKLAHTIELQVPELPRTDWASLDAESQKESDELMTRYISVSANVTSAESVTESMRRSLAAQGLAVRPEAIAGLTRMKLKMEDARRLIEQKRFGPARERLEAADGEAKKLLSALGG